jgi:hypothetical protein
MTAEGFISRANINCNHKYTVNCDIFLVLIVNAINSRLSELKLGKTRNLSTIWEFRWHIF